jgi:hypothetical protein
MYCVIAAICLPAPDRYVAVKRIEVHSVTNAPYSLGREQSCSTADEAVENYLAARGAIENCIPNEPQRFYSWMKAC